MTEVLAPPVGEVLTAETARLLVKGDVLKVMDPHPNTHSIGDLVTVVGTIPASSTEEWVKIVWDGVEVDQYPHRFKFHARPSLAAPLLKPCPFCGGAAEIVHIEDGENAGGSCVACVQCQASGNVEFGFKENFIENWNRRPSLAAPTVQEGEDLGSISAQEAEMPTEQTADVSSQGEMFGVTGASDETEALAVALFCVRCPGVRMTDEDLHYYRAAASRALLAVHEELDMPDPSGNPEPDAVGMKAEGRNEPNPNPHEAERRIALEAALTALVEAKALKEVRSTVAGWNGEGREEGPFDRHPPRLGASIATNCGAVYDLDEALTKARALLTTKTGE